MKVLEKTFMLVLIIIDAIAILIGMVSGPFDHTALSLGASLSAVIISAVIIVYCIINWKKKAR